jgi:PAS domain S-box-containing protein
MTGPLLYKDGSERAVAHRGQGIFNEEGEPNALEGLITDITDYQRAQRELFEASQRLAAHLDNSPLAVVEFDPAFRIVRWSDAAERLFGWTSEELLGRPITELRWVHEDDVEGTDRVMADMQANRRPRNVHVNRNYRKNGTVVHCEWYNSALYDAQGRLASIFSQVLDITERQRADEELSRARRLAEQHAADLQAVLQAVPAAVWIAHDAECRSITGNRTANEWLRLSEGAEASLTALEGLRPTHFKVCQNGRELRADELPVQRAAGGVEVRGFEQEIVFADGTVRPALGNATPLWDEEGRPRGAVAAFVDITTLKQAEEALREADRRKDEFLAILAHELRNPLAPIRNAVEILNLSGSSDPASRAARDMIERQVRHMVRLVDDLLDVSRITRGSLLLRRERLDLAAALEQTIEASAQHFQCAGIELIRAVPPQPVYVDADPVRLGQVFLNLLNNACKYTGKGGCIQLTVEQDGMDVVVKVADTGIGISPEHLPQVFDMFAQGGTGSEQGQVGLGIGLSLVRGLVEMHGGSVEARSDGPGKGSEFLVRLPTLAEQPASQPPASEDLGNLMLAPARRILVADDNTDVVESLALLLRVNGHEVETARDGLEAVELAARFRPDLVLMDIGMPKLDGYAACRRIRQSPWGKDLVIIALTGWGQDDDRRKAEEAGFNARLVKPVEPSALLRLLTGSQAMSA